MMKAIWRGDSDPLELINGKVYTVLSVEWDGTMFNVIDETGEDYLYPAEDFEVISDDETLEEDSDEPDYVKAHAFCNNHMDDLKKDEKCGCFYCMNIFSPGEIEEWIVDDNPCDELGTAICPYCDIDSVIGESSGYPITKEFLKKMNEYWFDGLEVK